MGGRTPPRVAAYLHAPPHPILRRLREERLAAGHSLTTFARKSGMTAASIGSHERGERAITLTALVEHAAHFGLEPVLRPIGAQEDDAYQRGYEDAVARICKALGIRTDDDPSLLDVDWDGSLAQDADELDDPQTAA
jgi:transcriptional regulator with XRE-family HTH domain